MNPFTRLFSWLDSLISSPAPPVPRRAYTKEPCPACHKLLAVSSRGVWRHKCEPEKPEAAS
jgi:hypothetical protein